MIHFDRDAWTTVFYWQGGITREIVLPSMFYLGYLIVVVSFQYALGNLNLHVQRTSLHVIMSFLVFLLVFRVNSTQVAHRHAIMEVERFFGSIESLIGLLCASLRGADVKDAVEVQREHAELALVNKLNVIRISLAFAIGFVFHSSLITATTEMQGMIDEESLHELVFLRHRLQGLLYSEEMEIVDQAIYVVREDHPADDRRKTAWNELCSVPTPVYRGEVFRRRPSKEFTGEVLIGCDTGSALEDPGAPLPKVLLPLLLNVLRLPVNQPWGMHERMWGQIWSIMAGLKDGLSTINSMCVTPTPLPYIQLSHLLVLIFAIFYPLTIDIEQGPVDTVVMPFLIFFTIRGFDALAKMLETATGHDVTDVNFMDMIHNLEVQAKYAFECSELHDYDLHKALKRPFQSFGFSTSAAVVGRHQLDGIPRRFGDYFTWLPMPPLIMGQLIKMHGHADTVQATVGVRNKAGIRKWIRRVVTRIHGGQLYSPIEGRTDDDDEEHMRMIHQQSVQRDPNFFNYYVVFAGVHDPALARASRRASRPETFDINRAWKQRVGRVLGSQPASEIFGHELVGDSDRFASRQGDRESGGQVHGGSSRTAIVVDAGGSPSSAASVHWNLNPFQQSRSALPPTTFRSTPSTSSRGTGARSGNALGEEVLPQPGNYSLPRSPSPQRLLRASQRPLLQWAQNENGSRSTAGPDVVPQRSAPEESTAPENLPQQRPSTRGTAQQRAKSSPA